MRLEPLYRIRWTTPEGWSVDLFDGAEGQSFFIAEGRCEGQVMGRFRAANFPRRRADGTLVPDFRGVVETDDGAVLMIALYGFLRSEGPGGRELVGSMTHLSDDDRYARLNDVVCTVVGEITTGGVVVDVAELVWEPLERLREPLSE
ncbi:MAG TPA: hypothetical protein VE596_04185 [Gaiellaceae bacterium]|jgi:hypothetical protein|nr:hypothetical protein [Gaiellaceae bacterium]